MTKQCSQCNEIKELEAFSLDKNGINGRRASCKKCVNAYTKSRYLIGYETKVCKRKGCENRCKTKRSVYCSKECNYLDYKNNKNTKKCKIDPKWLTRGTVSMTSGMDSISNG